MVINTESKVCYNQLVSKKRIIKRRFTWNLNYHLIPGWFAVSAAES